jgi:hypothetical protein
MFAEEHLCLVYYEEYSVMQRKGKPPIGAKRRECLE